MRGRSTVSSVVCLVTAALLLPFTAADASDYRHYVTGDLTAPAPGKVSGGLLLMGGGDRNFDALRWFLRGWPVYMAAGESRGIAFFSAPHCSIP